MIDLPEDFRDLLIELHDQAAEFWVGRGMVWEDRCAFS